MKNASGETTKSENGKWKIKNYNFFVLFCFRFTVYNEEHIFSSISTFAFKNDQLNSRNEKI